MKRQTLVTSALLINKNKQILVEKNTKLHSFKGMWQFPGGKVEPNETLKSSLIRELHEELGVVILAKDLIPIIFNEFNIESNFETSRHESFIVFFYKCQKWQNKVTAKEQQEIQLVDMKELKKLSLVPSNQLIINYLTSEII